MHIVTKLLNTNFVETNIMDNIVVYHVLKQDFYLEVFDLNKKNSCRMLFFPALSSSKGSSINYVYKISDFLWGKPKEKPSLLKKIKQVFPKIGFFNRYLCYISTVLHSYTKQSLTETKPRHIDYVINSRYIASFQKLKKINK